MGLSHINSRLFLNKPNNLRREFLEATDKNLEENYKEPVPVPVPVQSSNPNPIAGNQILSNYIKQMEIELSQTSSAENTTSTNAKSGAASGDFDFSVVPGFNDDFSSFYTQPSMTQLGAATSKNVIDEGYWDKALDALDQLRPQLHNYIKEQLESTGREYNYDTVDKFIDYFISNAVSMAITKSNFPTVQTVDNWDKCNQPTGNTTVNFSMASVVSALIEQIDAELGNESKYSAFGLRTAKHDAQDAFTETSWGKYDTLETNKTLYTADKFLDSDEKMLKTVLAGLAIPDDGAFGETTTSTIGTVKHILELYQDQVRNYLKNNYIDLTDEQITEIINEAMEITLNNADSMRISDGMNKGKYNLEQIILSFGNECDSIVAAKYPNSVPVDHHEGYLFGITGGAMMVSQLRVEATMMIEQKIPGVDKAVVNEILNIISSYGNKISRDDFETIIDQFVERCTIDEPIYDQNGKELDVPPLTTRLISSLYMEVCDEHGNNIGSLLKRDISEIIDEYLNNKKEETINLASDRDRLKSMQEDVQKAWYERVNGKPTVPPQEYTPVPNTISNGINSIKAKMDDNINRAFEIFS